MKKRLLWAALTGAALLLPLLSGCPQPQGGPASADASLKALTVDAGTLSPAFSPEQFNYTLTVENTVDSLTVSAEANDPKATVVILPAQPVSLTAGFPTTIVVTVTAENGEPRPYTITATRSLPGGEPNDAALGSLAVSSGTLSPAFSPDTTAYTLDVSSGITSLVITGQPNSPAAAVNPSFPQTVTLDTGENTFSFTVTAGDGTTTKTYTLTVTRAAVVQDNAKLAELTVGGVSVPLTQSREYPVLVPYTQDTALVTAQAEEDGAQVVIAPDSPVSLNPAGQATVITVTVTAPDGIATEVYTITVTHMDLSADATLTSLTLSNGTLDPVFDKDTEQYTAQVDHGVSRLSVNAEATHPAAVIDKPANPVSLNVGPNTITVVVTAEDGSAQKTYTITVTRAAPSANANLKALSVSAGTLDPEFSPAKTTYTVEVPYSTPDITINAEPDHPAAGIVKPDNPVTLNEGENTINVVVTAENGTTKKTYIITVNRAYASGDAKLKSLSISGGTLDPAFDANDANTDYTVTVANSRAETTVSAAANHSGAKVSGFTNPVDLTVGDDNTITVVVTAENGTTQKTYTITVNRAEPDPTNANLDILTVNSGTLDPVFDPETIAYTVEVPYATSDITVNAVPEDLGADWVPKDPVSLTVGNNTINVVVTAENGPTKTYTITVNRAAASSDATLKSLSISGGTLSPAFSANTTGYTVNVANSSTTTIVSAAVNHPGATVSGFTNPVTLNVGNNPINVVVTAEDGTTQKIYTITVNRARSTNANLGSLSVSPGTLTPAFSQAITSYTVSVPNATASISVTAAVADTGKATLNKPNNPISLTVGSNPINVVVTAENGTTQKTYTITVNRAEAGGPSLSDDATLKSLSVSPGTLSPAFSPTQGVYAVTVPNATTSISVTAVVADTGKATLNKPNNPISLTVGPNTINVVVTAENGTTKTYTVTVIREAPSAANPALTGISVNGTPVIGFDPANLTYSVDVGANTDKATVIGIPADRKAAVTYNPLRSQTTLSPGIPLPVTITVNSGDQTKVYTVTITRYLIPVTGIILNQTTATLIPGQTLQLSAGISPDNAGNKTLAWVSSNEGVATVANGLVTVAGNATPGGTTNITAAAQDGSGVTSNICVITVATPGGSGATAGITITFDTLSDETIDLTQNTQRDLSLSKNGYLTVSLTNTAGYNSWNWYVDGNYYRPGDVSIMVYSWEYSLGTHSLLAVIYTGGVPYTKEVIFKVVN